MAKNNKTINILSKLFGRKIIVKSNQPKIELPENPLVSKKVDKKTINFVKPNSRLATLWDYFLTQCHDSNDSFKNIQEVYKDMDYMYYNSPIYSRAVELYADEIVQQDSQKNIIEVYAKDKKIEKEINDLFFNLKIPEKIRSTGRGIVHKGNACWVLGTKKGIGVVEITQTKIENLVNRMEFAPLEIETILVKNQSLSNLVQNSIRLKQLIEDIEDFEDANAIFKKYLLGYQVNNFMMSPWTVLHFRNKVYDSIFDPFGMPLLINMVAPFRMYDSAMTMHTLARGMRFPIEKIEVDLPNSYPTEMLEQLLEFIQEYENSGLAETEASKEENTLGTKVYTVKNLFDYSIVESRQNLSDIADVELLKDNLILASGVPRHWFDPNASSFGTSGIALTQQYKPFGRAVFSLQGTVLEELTLLIKIHLAFKGLDVNSEFELSMPYPESEENPDRLRIKSDMLRFANDIMGALKDNVIGDRDAKIPPDVSKMIYTTILPFENEEIEKWINKTVEFNKEEEDEEENKQDFRSSKQVNTEYKKILKEKGERGANNFVRKLITIEDIKMYEYDIRKKRNWLEGIKNNRHYVYSSNFNPVINPDSLCLENKDSEKLEKLDKKTTKQIIEDFKNNNRKIFQIKNK